jgi:Zn-dependent membrane protease YugP
MVPSVRFGSWLGPVIFFLGLLMNLTSIAWLGVILFAGVALFSLVTLPVELDASRRAKALLQQRFMVDSQGMVGISKVLNAAALTYVAAAIQAVSTLLYYVFLLGGSRRRD